MENGVTWIFRKLIKVPVIILVSFGILNIFAFTVSYFRIVGASNTLQQAVMDNNYLTKADEETFKDYLASLETAYLQNIRLVIDTEVDNKKASPNYEAIEASGNTNTRKQYGNVIDVGVVAEYKFIMPLQHTETLKDGKVAGYGGTSTGASGGIRGDLDTYRGDTAATQSVNTDFDDLKGGRADKFGGTIAIVNRVIGMQYYSDLD